MSKTKNILGVLGIGALILVGAIVVALLFYGSKTSKEHMIELREDGFYPKELTIQKGDTVMFTTSLEKPFWPASNLHPSHTIYSEFDPKEPIEPGKSWSLRFDKTGEWKYHDHLIPLYTGIISVVDKVRGIDFSYVKICQDENQHSPQCWQEMVNNAFEEKGLRAAYELFRELYDEEPNFARNCHDISHTLGEVAYDTYAQGKEFTLEPQASYCAFGFYHGLMEALVGTEGDAKKASEFCSYVDEQLSEERPGAKFACYHGVGHGWASYHEDNPEEWNIINSSLPFCEEFAETPQQLLLCATGVFDTIAIFYYNPSYGMEMNKEDPFWLCREQSKDVYKEACYREMVTALLWLANYDAVKGVHMVEEFVEDDYVSIALRDIVDASTRFVMNTPNLFDVLPTCRSLKESLRLVCVEGLFRGVMQFGAPEVEYKKALELCEDLVFSEDEKKTCFATVLNYSAALYSREKVQNICISIKEEYRTETCSL